MASRSKALVVDDEAVNRLLLKTILSKSNFEVFEVEDGAQAVERFDEIKPDIVFMDVMMPVMDGFEATAIIKEKLADVFVPIIFLTALTDKESLARCIEAGGDDFLTKPISSVLLKAKIRALERIRDLQRQAKFFYDQMRHDEEVAKSVFEQIIKARNDDVNGIRHHLVPASLFNGDMLLMEVSPAGDLNILLADFTGHGLSAALGAMPASDAFRAMTKKGYSVERILSQINGKLYHCLPKGMFMAMQFVSINKTLNRVLFSNCGMPDALVIAGEGRKIKQRLKSQGLPLGVSEKFDCSSAIECLSLVAGDHIVLASDGIVEAESASGEYFGEARFEAAVAQSVADDYALDTVVAHLAEFCQDAAQHDDISIVEIPHVLGVDADLVSFPADKKSTQTVLVDDATSDCFDIAMSFEGPMLARVDPVPMVVGHVTELVALADQKSVLFTIVAELYNNALEHGVLGLESALKNSAEGFAEYYGEREKRLNALEVGHVRVAVKVEKTAQGGVIKIMLEDSGPGFDFSGFSSALAEEDGLSRRGIALLNELCESLEYKGDGNVVEAVYRWVND